VPTYKFSTPSHATRAWGVIHGAGVSTSQNSRFDITAERYAGGIFMLNAGSTLIGGFYTEGNPNVVEFGIVAAQSNFSVLAVHAYMSGTGSMFDCGRTFNGAVNLSGIVFPAGFGKPPEYDAGSSLRLGTMAPPGFPGFVNRANVFFVDADGPFTIPAIGGGASNLGSPYNDVGYRITRQGRVELQGAVINVAGAPTLFTLPPGFRPYAINVFSGSGGNFRVLPSGDVVVDSGGPTIFLDGKSFLQFQ
jgi:hypothetical protein